MFSLLLLANSHAVSLRSLINGLPNSPVFLQLQLMLLLHLHMLLGQIIITLMYLVYLTQIIVIGQRTKRIVIDAMMAMSLVTMMRRKVREIICNDKKMSQKSPLNNWAN